MKTIFLFLALNLSCVAHATTDGGSEGGGGGAGICIANKCKTLPEAGFRILNPSQRGYEVEIEVVDELDRLVNLLPKEFGLKTAEVVGNPGDIVLVESADKKKSQRFLDEYHNLLKMNGARFTHPIELLGFTSPNASNPKPKTYLLSDKWAGLDSRSRALLLIHESSLRSKKRTLENALKYDGAILDYLSAVESGKIPNLRSILAALKGTGTIPHSELQSLMLNEISKTSGPINFGLMQRRVDQLASNDMYGGNYYERKFDGEKMGTGTITFTYADLLHLRKFDPNITNDLVAGDFEVKTSKRADLLIAYFEYWIPHQITAANPVFRSDDAAFEKFLAAIKTKAIDDPRFNDLNLVTSFEIDLLNQCGDVRDQTTTLFSRNNPTSFEEAVIIGCDSSDSYRWRVRIPAYAYFPKLNGLKLNSEMNLCRKKNGEIFCTDK